MKPSSRNAVLIPLTYALGAALWILFSDLLIGYFIKDAKTLIVIGTIKGWGFVGVTALLLYALLRNMTVAVAGPVTDNQKEVSRKSAGTGLILSILIVIVLIILTGLVSIQNLSERSEAHNTARLQAIAKLKADQIGQWLTERRNAAELIRTYAPLHSALRQWRVEGDRNSLDSAMKILMALEKNTGYQNVIVADRHEENVLGVDSKDLDAPALHEAIERAFATGEVQFTGFYRDGNGEKQYQHFDFVATLVEMPEFVLIMRLDQRSFLFPFLQNWPLPSTSAETQLFKTDGDGVLFLNELRYRRDSAMSLRIPFSDKDILAVQVATKQVATGDLITGTDYRGEHVVGVAQRVPGTHWYLITKQDRKEVLADLQEELFWIGLALFLALFAVLAGALLFRQHRQLHLTTLRQRDQAEASLDIVFKALPDNYFRLALDGTVLDYRARPGSEIIPMPKEMLGTRLQDVLPSDVVETCSTQISTAIETGELVSCEYSHASPHAVHFYEARLARLPEKNQLIAVVRDMSERKHAEARLDYVNRLYATLSQIGQAMFRQRDRQGLFQAVCDIAVESGKFKFAWIGIVSADGESVEPAAYSGEGTDYLRHIHISLKDELTARGPTGRSIREERCIVFNDLEHNPDYRLWREHALQKGYRSSGAFPIHLNGSVIGALNVYAVESHFFDDDQIHLLVDAVQEISFALEKICEEERRRQMERTLLEGKARLRTLIDTLPDLVWLKDPDGVYLACNHKFERMYGASEIEIVGKSDYDFVDESLANFFREKDKAAMAAGRPSMNEEELTFADDGHTELVETIKTPMYDENGALIGVLGIGRDITERKHTEAELAAHLEELQRWQDVTLGREMRGLELKREINDLLLELGRSPRYPSAGQEGESRE